jgi:hypothetical protein
MPHETLLPIRQEHRPYMAISGASLHKKSIIEPEGPETLRNCSSGFCWPCAAATYEIFKLEQCAILNGQSGSSPVRRFSLAVFKLRCLSGFRIICGDFLKRRDLAAASSQIVHLHVGKGGSMLVSGAGLPSTKIVTYLSSAIELPFKLMQIAKLFPSKNES